MIIGVDIISVLNPLVVRVTTTSSRKAAPYKNIQIKRNAKGCVYGQRKVTRSPRGS